MKTEQGILQVRVGGGYQKIADFVEMYYSIEKEKIDRSKITKRPLKPNQMYQTFNSRRNSKLNKSVVDLNEPILINKGKVMSRTQSRAKVVPPLLLNLKSL